MGDIQERARRGRAEAGRNIYHKTYEIWLKAIHTRETRVPWQQHRHNLLHSFTSEGWRHSPLYHQQIFKGLPKGWDQVHLQQLHDLHWLYPGRWHGPWKNCAGIRHRQQNYLKNCLNVGFIIYMSHCGFVAFNPSTFFIIDYRFSCCCVAQNWDMGGRREQQASVSPNSDTLQSK